MTDLDKKTPFRVPERYFEGLQDRLSAIPSDEAVPSGSGVLKPCLAMAAAFAMIIAAGTAVFRSTAGDSYGDMSTLDMMRIADLVPVTEPDYMYVQARENIGISENDITEYLIDSGTTLDYIEYCGKY